MSDEDEAALVYKVETMVAVWRPLERRGIARQNSRKEFFSLLYNSRYIKTNIMASESGEILLRKIRQLSISQAIYSKTDIERSIP